MHSSFYFIENVFNNSISSILVYSILVFSFDNFSHSSNSSSFIISRLLLFFFNLKFPRYLIAYQIYVWPALMTSSALQIWWKGEFRFASAIHIWFLFTLLFCVWPPLMTSFVYRCWWKGERKYYRCLSIEGKRKTLFNRWREEMGCRRCCKNDATFLYFFFKLSYAMC